MIRIKIWLPWLILAAFAFPSVHAQTTNPAVTQAAFDTAYWASKPTPVAALAKLKVDFEAPAPSGRTATAIQLATQGYIIDGPIMVWGADPYLEMLTRHELGYTWVPSLLQPNIEDAPGFPPYGTTPAYNASVIPPGSVPVTLALSAYPPFNPPAPVRSTSGTYSGTCVGAALGVGYYAAPYYSTVPACALPDGRVYTSDPRGSFTFHVSVTPFGSDTWFTQ